MPTGLALLRLSSHLVLELLHVDVAHLDVRLPRAHHLLEQGQLRLELVVPRLQRRRALAHRRLDRRWLGLGLLLELVALPR